MCCYNWEQLSKHQILLERRKQRLRVRVVGKKLDDVTTFQ